MKKSMLIGKELVCWVLDFMSNVLCIQPHPPAPGTRKNLTRSLNTEEAAEILGIRPATLRGWKAQRVGPPFIQLSPRCVRYDEQDIHTYANERKVVPSVRDNRRRNETR